MFAKPELIHAAVLSVVYSSYIGLVLYRLSGNGRLPFNVFFNPATTAKEQLTFLLILLLVTAGALLPFIFKDKVSSYTLQILVCSFLPFFFLGIFATYILPATTSRCLNYPLRIEDKPYDEAEDDDKYLVEQASLIED
jgi:hypothetical protein